MRRWWEARRAARDAARAREWAEQLDLQGRVEFRARWSSTVAMSGFLFLMPLFGVASAADFLRPAIDA